MSRLKRIPQKCCYNCAYSHTLEPYEKNAEYFNENFRLCGAVKIEQYFPKYEKRNNCHRYKLQPKEERNGVPYYMVSFQRGRKTNEQKEKTKQKTVKSRKSMKNK